MNIFDELLNLIFPPKCEVCRRGSPEALCGECFSQIKFMKPNLGIYSATAYDGVIKESIHRFKFNKRKKLAEPLGVLLVNYLGHKPGLKIDELDGIIPVPLHEKRMRERGFNQVELLASTLTKYFELPVTPALERLKNTHPQFDLQRDARLNNVKGAFRVINPKAVYNKKVLLLDDIYTTGATISECGRVLKNAGAKRVEVLTLARAV
ncbi:MAG: ComF family protein [bacterium]